MIALFAIYTVAMLIILGVGIFSRNHGKKFRLMLGLILSVIMALCVSIWFAGGELLWVRFVMELPVPDTLKYILWGWY